ncbi:TRAP transporter, DctM subunit [Roseovarius litoreus]|uniref:TRAP transporter large permease protein n=1 Tax=Roseovarius litoreus TaxID=1155722 RepID=A0A1M7LL84_9RHOB|nr:TRAP transporter large permease subunit [Roseovarius litoreus]SHM78772.1 TRAP transporter, DctM subunit [Roseovarius litoreus]
MDAITIGLSLMGMLAFLLVSGTWIFVSLLLIAGLGLSIFLGYPMDRIGSIGTRVILTSAQKWELAAIPLFVFMGELIYRSDISDRMFRGLLPVVGRFPGSLLHTNVLGSIVFGAVSGSSSATTAMVGKITLPNLEERGFDRKTALGALAASGGLGLLIPPSIMLIVYGVMVEQSIIRLFAAGVVPGLLIGALFSLYIALRHGARAKRAAGGSAIELDRDQLSFGNLWQLGPIAILFTIVLGAIYSGIATPSESAAIGVLATAIVLVALRQFNLRKSYDAIIATVLTSSMICIILIVASFLSSAMGFLHLPQIMAESAGGLIERPYVLIAILALFYLLMGCFLDGISIAVMTLPIVFPMISQAGFDPIWFGVFLVITVEAGLITPPLGFNLFIVSGMSGEPIGKVARAALPFFFLMLLFMILLICMPGIALWLPDVMQR